MTTTFRCGRCEQEILARVQRDDDGTWRVTTYPNLFARRIKDAFGPHGEDHVQDQLESIQRSNDEVIDPDATYELDCGRCVRRGRFAGATLIRESRTRNVPLTLPIDAHIDEIPQDHDPEAEHQFRHTTPTGEVSTATGRIPPEGSTMTITFDDGAVLSFTLGTDGDG